MTAVLHPVRKTPKVLPHVGLILVLVAIVALAASRTDAFLTPNNLLNVLRQVSVVAVIAAGLTLLMTAGGMDFSMGGNVAVTTAVAAQLLAHGHPVWSTVVASIALSVVIGLVNGAVVTFTPVAPFVATLATATLLDGVALLILNGLSVSIGAELFGLGNGATLGLPHLTIVAVVIGGTSLAGGKGTIAGTVLGVLLLGVVANVLNLLQISSYYQQISVGAVLLVAAIANLLRRADHA